MLMNDDINVLVTQHNDVSLADEFANVVKWSTDNKMIINKYKTKKIIVFRHPGSV